MRAPLLVALLWLTASCDRLAPARRDAPVAAATVGASDVALYDLNAPMQVQAISLAENPGAAAPASLPGNTILIRTGRVSLEVGSLDSAIGTARTIATRMGGFAAGLDRNVAVSWRPVADLTLRVPVRQLDAAIDALTALGHVETVRVTSEEVTEEFVDVTARLENARRLERRVLDLLSRGTGKLTDVLQVEEKLARVREDVERIEGRRRYLQSRSEMSTIELALHEAGTPPPPRVASAFGDAFGQARRNFMVLTTAAIEASGVLVPLGVIGAIVWLIVRRGRRRLDPAADATL